MEIVPVGVQPPITGETNAQGWPKFPEPAPAKYAKQILELRQEYDKKRRQIHNWRYTGKHEKLNVAEEEMNGILDKAAKLYFECTADSQDDLNTPVTKKDLVALVNVLGSAFNRQEQQMQKLSSASSQSLLALEDGRTSHQKVEELALQARIDQLSDEDVMDAAVERLDEEEVKEEAIKRRIDAMAEEEETDEEGKNERIHQEVDDMDVSEKAEILERLLQDDEVLAKTCDDNKKDFMMKMMADKEVIECMDDEDYAVIRRVYMAHKKQRKQ